MAEPATNMEYTKEDQELLATAKRAAAEFANMDPAQVQKILSAVCHALLDKAEYYAEWAVRETGYGNYSDKVLKNMGGSVFQLINYSAYDFALPKIDHIKKIVSFPKPAGTILSLVPVTNPTSTVMVKSCYAIATRNATIMCGHPGAKECSNDTARFIAEVAEAHGMPKGAIQWLESPNIDQVGRLMKSDQIDVILATGGPAMVRAAYSSGNPAIGVGPANVPCYVDRSAKVKKAAKRITDSVSFDNSLPCTCESTVLADSAIADKLRKALSDNKHRPTAWVSGANLKKLREYVYPDGKFNPECLGKQADEIAKNAGFKVPEGTRTLLVEIKKIGFDEPLSYEKMWPCLAFLEVKDSDDGLEKALAMLAMTGKGHSAAVHAGDTRVVAKFGEALPVCRISVNVSAFSGSSGMETNLPMSAVIGTGYFGRSSKDVNITPDLLIQWTRCAYNLRPNVLMGAMDLSVTKPNPAIALKNKAAIAADRAKILAKAVPLMRKHAPQMKLL